MRTFDDEARGPRNNRDRRNNDKPQKFNRRDNDGGRDGRHSDRKFGRDDDYKPRTPKFNRERKPRSFDEDMRNPDNDNFYGKKKDKASKYYDAPEYQKKHHEGHHGGKPSGKPERFRTKNYKDYDNFDEFDDNNYQERRIRRSEKPKQAKKENEETRLNKYIANAGICSRREADTYIQAGVVTINGEVVTELGTKVKPGDEVRFGGELINPEKLVYILLNKPKNCVTTLDDPEERQTVMDLVKDACPERIYPVGRLDRNTTGLLLLTNDGDLTKKLTHPSYEKKKIYQVETDKNISKADLQALADGFELEDGFIAADAVSYVGDSKNIIGVEIHSGRNRIVRRMLEHLGYEVKRLDRVYFAGLIKLNLPRGKQY